MVTTGVFFGIFGFVFANVLQEPGQILSWYRELAEKAISFRPTALLTNYLYTILGGCAKCTAGAMCLLYQVFTEWPVLSFGTVKVIVVNCTIAIFITYVIERQDSSN